MFLASFGGVLPLPLTVSDLAKVAIFTTNVDADNQTLINLRRGVLRSTEPPLFPNPC